MEHIRKQKKTYLPLQPLVITFLMVLFQEHTSSKRHSTASGVLSVVWNTWLMESWIEAAEHCLHSIKLLRKYFQPGRGNIEFCSE
ncbi:hypothetical protein XELAEV_18019967mg [Xenopus laevis]|uniref:Uncharacterized protein n=1 Tax=Xenopus laevis TaxID=8355 RepID=A0A974D7V2_XENLA|nr:hypothetical protein XELAEV_18019967mg [Xenopus laevis]